MTVVRLSRKRQSSIGEIKNFTVKLFVRRKRKKNMYIKKMLLFSLYHVRHVFIREMNWSLTVN